MAKRKGVVQLSGSTRNALKIDRIEEVGLEREEDECVVSGVSFPFPLVSSSEDPSGELTVTDPPVLQKYQSKAATGRLGGYK
jgi:hypothetical protein